MNQHLARLKKLEQAVAPPATGDSTVIYLPEEENPDGTPASSPQVRAAWEEYIRNGPKPGGQVVIYPADVGSLIRPLALG